MTKDTYFDLAEKITTGIAHCAALSMKVIEADKGHLTLALPYSESIIGNPSTRVIHGGALTALMDSTCGFSVILALEELQVCPTLDLRIDYMTSAEPDLPVYGTADVFRVTSNVVFVKGVAWQTSKDKPIAHCVATFMRMQAPKKDAKTDTPNNQKAEAATEKPKSQSFKVETSKLVSGPNDFIFGHDIPYVKQLGLEAIQMGNELLFRLPVKKDNEGNPFLPAIHGGATGGAMELAATAHVMRSIEASSLPKVVDFSIDYLRAGKMEDIFIECDVVRQGRKIVNVSVVAWQSKREQAIATARLHFLLKP